MITLWFICSSLNTFEYCITSHRLGAKYLSLEKMDGYPVNRHLFACLWCCVWLAVCGDIKAKYTCVLPLRAACASACQFYCSCVCAWHRIAMKIHCKPNVAMMPTLLLLVLPQVVVTTTSKTISDGKVGIITIVIRFAVLCFVSGISLVLKAFTSSIYPYSSGWHHWHWSSICRGYPAKRALPAMLTHGR